MKPKWKLCGNELPNNTRSILTYTEDGEVITWIEIPKFPELYKEGNTL